MLYFTLKDGGNKKTFICPHTLAKINTEKINQKPGVIGDKVEKIKGEVHL